MAKALAPRALVVAGGGFLTSMPHDVMRLLPQVDVGVVGEAFLSFPSYCAAWTRAIATGRPCAASSWRDPAGASHLTPEQRCWTTSIACLTGVGTVPPRHLLSQQHVRVLGRRHGRQAAARHQRELRLLAHLPLLFPSRIAGDMEYVQKDGQPDVRFGYKRAIRYHSPRYVVELVKYARSKVRDRLVSFLDENLMTMHQSSGKTWLTDIARLWIEEGLQPQCVRDGVPHDPERCSGIPLGRDQPRHPLQPRGPQGDQGGRLLAPALRLRDVLGARDEDDRQGARRRQPTSGHCAGRWRRAFARSRTR